VNIIYSLEKIAPSFVSEISFSTKSGKVLINWKNPENFNEILTIYRNKEKIDNADKLLKSEKIATLSDKEEKYIDSPGAGNFYYAVIITNKDNNKDNIALVPFRNYNINPVEVLNEDILIIKKFKSISNKYSINLSWDYELQSGNIQNIFIYRNTEPITNDDILKKSIKIASLKADAKFYVDIPIPKIIYYYAIFTENESEKTYTPNVNITDIGVSIESKTDLMNNFRADSFIPLPLLSFEKDPKSGNYFNDSQILKNPKMIQYSEKLNKVITDLKKSKTYPVYLKDREISLKDLDFTFLKDEEIFTPKEYTNEYTAIINHLKNKEYNNARFLLEQSITEILPKEILKRISFYLGVICYTNKEYNYAYIYLVSCHSDFPKDVSPYLSSITYKVFDTLER